MGGGRGRGHEQKGIYTSDIIIAPVSFPVKSRNKYIVES